MNNKKSIANLSRLFTSYITFLTVFFTVVIAVLIFSYFYTKFRDIKQKTIYWNNTFNQMLILFDNFSAMSSGSEYFNDIQQFQIDKTGTILSSNIHELVGLNIYPSTFYKSLIEIEKGELHIGIYPDFYSGSQKVFIAKFVDNYYFCKTYNPERFFPGNIHSSETILVLTRSLVIYSNRKDWIGNYVVFKNLLFKDNKFYIASLLNITRMEKSSVILLNDISKSVLISLFLLIISFGLVVCLFYILKVLSRSFNTLKEEQGAILLVSTSFADELEKTHHGKSEYIAIEQMLENYFSKLRDINVVFYENSILIHLLTGFIAQSKEFVNRLEFQAREQAMMQQQMISSQKKSLTEKDVLIKEIHHRVKNNLQIIISLLQLQENKTNDNKTRDNLVQMTNRIQTMALVHEQLYGMYNTTNFAVMSPGAYFEKLSAHLFSSLDKTFSTIHLDIDVEELTIQEMIPLGLITNEFITNSIKYAKVNNGEREIFLFLKKNTDTISYYYRDNGIFFENQSSNVRAGSLGLELIQNLVIQLRGKLEFIKKDNNYFYYFSFIKQK